MGKDYYAIMGVAKNADENELKKGMANGEELLLFQCTPTLFVQLSTLSGHALACLQRTENWR